MCVGAIDCEHNNRLARATAAIRADDAMGAFPPSDRDAVASWLALVALSAAEASDVAA